MPACLPAMCCCVLFCLLLQLLVAGKLTPAADVYSFGIMREFSAYAAAVSGSFVCILDGRAVAAMVQSRFNRCRMHKGRGCRALHLLLG
jgi:hypothetical protein